MKNDGGSKNFRNYHKLMRSNAPRRRAGDSIEVIRERGAEIRAASLRPTRISSGEVEVTGGGIDERERLVDETVCARSSSVRGSVVI